MTKFKLINSKEKDLKMLYNNSALTIEGLSKDSIGDWVKVLEDYFTDAAKKNGVEVYVTTGKLMNDFYELDGNVAYQDGLTIVSFKTLDYFANIGKLAVDRFSWGGRWFDDIVTNNAHHMGYDESFIDAKHNEV